MKYLIFNTFGDLEVIIEAHTRHQLAIAIDDWADEFQEGCSLQSQITERDWQTLNIGMGNISIVCDISGGNEIEVKGMQARDYTHFPKEGEE